MKTGVCALCRKQSSELRESHLLPKAIYKIIRSPNHRPPDPVLLTVDREEQTSFQAKRHLLCGDCEERLHRHGEDWTLEACARPEGFKLREQMLLQRADPLPYGLSRFECNEIPFLNTDALSYFAISVIWRAAVCRWQIAGQDIGQRDLGSYEAAFRSYLYGTSGFPANTVVSVVVSSLESAPLEATFPESNKIDGYRMHFFSIPGLDVTVDVGSRMPESVRDLCLSRGSIFYGSLADWERHAAMLAVMRFRTDRAHAVTRPT